ncbi:MAG: hypothetical protein GX638_17860 [Crenarchaeota archaeon]|nr:hypothetical protein [Thermoproteota archaeon]
MESFVKDYGYPDLVTGFGIPNFVYFLDGDKSVNISSAGIYLIDGKSTKLSDKPFGGAKEKDKLFLTYSVK